MPDIASQRWRLVPWYGFALSISMGLIVLSVTVRSGYAQAPSAPQPQVMRTQDVQFRRKWEPQVMRTQDVQFRRKWEPQVMRTQDVQFRRKWEPRVHLAPGYSAYSASAYSASAQDNPRTAPVRRTSAYRAGEDHRSHQVQIAGGRYPTNHDVYSADVPGHTTGRTTGLINNRPVASSGSAPPSRSHLLTSSMLGSRPSNGTTMRRHPEPWWQGGVKARLLKHPKASYLSLQRALSIAASRAPEIRALAAEVEGRSHGIVREQGEFDWSSFVETIWNEDNTPVGSQLDGTNSRLKQKDWSFRAGLRKRSRTGSTVELYQDYGFRTSNSRFITPRNQGTARLSVEYTHPLLRGRGSAYNDGPSRIALAQRDQAEQELAVGTEDHLLAVADAYWNLAYARARVVLALKAWQRIQATRRVMQKRADVDVTRTQLLRAAAAESRRSTKFTEAEFDALQAQERLLRLVYGQVYQQETNAELLLTTLPSISAKSANLDSALQNGLQHHPNVSTAIQQVRRASIAQQLAQHEVMPQLDLVLSAYSAGLRGGGKFYDAARDQFTSSTPGYGVGLQFEFPLGNRVAQAAAAESDAAVRRLRHEFQTVVADVALDIRNEYLSLQKASRVLRLSLTALDSAKTNLANLETRRQFLVDGSNVGDLYLDALIQAQDRLSSAEQRVLEAQVSCELAEASLLRAQGILRKQVR